MKFNRLLILSIATLGAGIGFGTMAVGTTTDPEPSHDRKKSLGVETKSGECIFASGYTPKGEPHTDAPRSPDEAVKVAQDGHPKLKDVKKDKAKPDRFERFEEGRKVAAVKIESFTVEADKSTVWYPAESEFAAPCDYVNPAHLKASKTVPEGVTPAGPEEAAPADRGAPEAERNHQKRASERAAARGE